MDFIKFNIPTRPKWRNSQRGDGNNLSIPDMLNDIVDFRKNYASTSSHMSPRLTEKIKDLEITFFVDIQLEEDIGVKDHRATKSLIDKYERDESKGKKRPLHEDNESPQRKRPHYSSSKSVEEIISLHQNISKERQTTPVKSELETINLYKAYKKIMSPLAEMAEEEKSACASLLDVDYFIKETHAILMTGLEDKFKTPPGSFSTQPRYTVIDGARVSYPEFSTEDEASKAVQTIVDQYNKTVEYIKSQKEEKKKVEAVFKCAAKLLFCFLTLHPFFDGNGRLGRLLCNYCLSLISPFPTAVYNVYSPSTRDDHINALRSPRGDVKDENLLPNLLSSEPSDLCAMIIESNWYSWKEFFKQIEKLRNKEKTCELPNE